MISAMIQAMSAVFVPQFAGMNASLMKLDASIARLDRFPAECAELSLGLDSRAPEMPKNALVDLNNAPVTSHALVDASNDLGALKATHVTAPKNLPATGGCADYSGASPLSEHGTPLDGVNAGVNSGKSFSTLPLNVSGALSPTDLLSVYTVVPRSGLFTDDSALVDGTSPKMPNSALVDLQMAGNGTCPKMPNNALVDLHRASTFPEMPNSALVDLRIASTCPEMPNSALVDLRNAPTCPIGLKPALVDDATLLRDSALLPVGLSNSLGYDGSSTSLPGSTEEQKNSKLPYAAACVKDGASPGTDSGTSPTGLKEDCPKNMENAGASLNEAVPRIFPIIVDRNLPAVIVRSLPINNVEGITSKDCGNVQSGYSLSGPGVFESGFLGGTNPVIFSY
jgi:hypothetical protein